MRVPPRRVAGGDGRGGGEAERVGEVDPGDVDGHVDEVDGGEEPREPRDGADLDLAGVLAVPDLVPQPARVGVAVRAGPAHVVGAGRVEHHVDLLGGLGGGA